MERVEYESLIIQDLLGYFNRDELNLSPWYQRRSVWTRSQQAYLINTIHERKPIPALYIRHSIDLETERTINEVVDGQQRIRCVVAYSEDKFAARHPAHDRPVRFSELSKKQRISFRQSSLPIGYLVDATDKDVIEIFARINTVSKTLNPQEKRNARYGGEFKQFCLRKAVDLLPFWQTNKIFTSGQIARMLEVQFISDLVLNMMAGLQDFRPSALNDLYEKHDDDFPAERQLDERLNRVFSILINLPEQMLSGTIFAVPQLLLSLLIVIDDQLTSGTPADDLNTPVVVCINDIDALVQARKDGDPVLSRNTYEAFTSGNLHRIKQRRLRDATIRSYFA